MGFAVAIWAVGATGLGQIVSSALRMGLVGFLAYCAWSGGVFLILGAAWLSAAPGEPIRRLWLFSWARMVREAFADLMPLSQLGGIVVSTRTLMTSGVGRARVYGSMVVDMTTEMAGQLVYTLFGLAFMTTLLIGDGAGAHLRPYILGGTGVMIALILAFFGLQRAALDLAGRMLGHFLPGSREGLGEVREELTRIYAHRKRVLLAVVFNLAAWVASGMGAWIVLHLMGAPLSVGDVLSLESLIFSLRAMAFFIPGALGVQEAAYVLVGPIFGLPPEMALALSLAKRAREVAMGVPTLLIWQFQEMRALAARRRKR